MTSVAAPHVRPSEPTPLQAARTDALRPEDRAALCYDLLQPYIADYSCFSQVIAAEAARYWGRPRMIDLACGTGTVALPILAAAHDLDYLGFDPSEAMVRVFRRKTAKVERPRRVITLTAPMDPRRREVPVSAYGGTAELVVMANFLQYAPLSPAPDGRYHQIGLLGLLRSLLRPGGKAFLLEEVLGENAEEEAEFTLRWNQAMVSRWRPVFDQHLAPILRQLDPELEALARNMLTHPPLAAAVRERLHREPGRQRLPLSGWDRILGHLGWSYAALRHPEIQNLCLFAIRA